MENPILAMIPSGYNAADAKLYSILPSDGSGDFTVSVDADATRINKEGLIWLLIVKIFHFGVILA